MISRGIEQFGYSAASYRRTPFGTTVAIINICVASLGLLTWGAFEHATLNELLQVDRARQRAQQTAAGRATLFANAEVLSKAAADRASKLAPGESSYRALKPDEVTNILDRIQTQLASPTGIGAFTRAQRSVLSERLSSDGQKLIDPNVPLGSDIPGRLQVIRAFVDQQGVLSLYVNHGNGNFYFSRLNPTGTDLGARISSAWTMSRPLPTTLTPQMLQNYHVQYIRALAVVLVQAVNILLSALLFVAGFCMLMSYRQGIRLLWLYVALQIMACIVEGTPFLRTVFGTSIPVELPPVYFPLVVLSGIYSICMLFMVLARTFRGLGFVI